MILPGFCSFIPIFEDLLEKAFQMKSPFLFAYFQFLCCLALSQPDNHYWKELHDHSIEASISPSDGMHYKSFRVYTLNSNILKEALKSAPEEFSEAAKAQSLLVLLPMPQGQLLTFAVWESPIMEEELATRFSEIKTYSGYCLSNPELTVRFGFTYQGFHAIMHVGGQTAMILPLEAGNTGRYRVYWQRDAIPVDYDTSKLRCEFDEIGHDFISSERLLPSLKESVKERGLFVRDLQTYRLAIATTAEYSFANGNTATSVLSAVTIVINKVNSFYEKENAIRFILIGNTTQTFFFGSTSSDPFTNGKSGTMISEVTNVLNNAYSSSGYDVGHVFGTTSGGGVVGTAVLASACGTNKSKGASNMINIPSFYSIVVHELGHQFNATHTFNFCDGENEETGTAFQPGGGSTFMDYAGACGSNSVQTFTDDYFHINSLERIRLFSRNTSSGGSCAQVVPVGNAPPETSIPLTSGLNIPIKTPFQLTGNAIDPEKAPMTYCWEQYDLGPKSTLGKPEGTAPLFRSYPPTSSKTRIFPRWESLSFNTPSASEVLPTVGRLMTFRFTARDNHPVAGAYGYSEIIINAANNAGPFEITYPDVSGLVLEVGKTIEVTWKVSNTDQPPVNCRKVHIRLSNDGGLTFPFTLLENTDNDGSASIVVPNIPTSQGRIRIEAVDNIFFDFSSVDFWITRPSVPGFLMSVKTNSAPVCLPDTLKIEINTESMFGFKYAIDLKEKGLPEGAKVSYTQNPVVPGNSSLMTVVMKDVKATGTFIVTISGKAPEADSAEVRLDIKVISPDFTNLSIVSPSDGASGVSILPVFEWKFLDNALTYDFELATSPIFGKTIISTAKELNLNHFTPGASLNENTTYYWRVRATNECGTGDFQNTSSFRTVAQICKTLSSTHSPISISSIGLPRILSAIGVTDTIAISDFNIRSVKGNHTAVGHLELRLLSPQGDSIILMPAIPCSSNQLNLGFDDESAALPIPCPPNTGLMYRPSGRLATFNGRNPMGNWTLVTAVVNNDGEGGSFTGWTLEYCGAATQKNPYLLKNDTLAVPPLGSRIIYTNKLQIADDDSPQDKLLVTIVKNPSLGFISKGGVRLSIGDSFSLADLKAGILHYTNTDSTAKQDFFSFVVADDSGGFLGTPRFYLTIDPDAPPSRTGFDRELHEIRVFPNPSLEYFTIEADSPVTNELLILLHDARGRLMHYSSQKAGFKKTRIDVSELPSGTYILQLRTAIGISTLKLAVLK